jgi:hypothetical protein
VEGNLLGRLTVERRLGWGFSAGVEAGVLWFADRRKTVDWSGRTGATDPRVVLGWDFGEPGALLHLRLTAASGWGRDPGDERIQPYGFASPFGTGSPFGSGSSDPVLLARLTVRHRISHDLALLVALHGGRRWAGNEEDGFPFEPGQYPTAAREAEDNDAWIAGIALGFTGDRAALGLSVWGERLGDQSHLGVREQRRDLVFRTGIVLGRWAALLAGGRATLTEDDPATAWDPELAYPDLRFEMGVGYPPLDAAGEWVQGAP